MHTLGIVTHAPTLALHSHHVYIVFFRIPNGTNTAPPHHLSSRTKPPLDQLVTKQLSHIHRSSHTGSCPQTFDRLARKQQAPPLHTTQAARVSSASCVGRSAFSPLCLVSTLTQTLLHRSPSRASALTHSSGRGLVLPCITSVAPHDCHKQEEPLYSPPATPKLLLTSIAAVHHRDRQGPPVRKRATSRRATPEDRFKDLDTPFDNIRSTKAQLHSNPAIPIK